MPSSNCEKTGIELKAYLRCVKLRIRAPMRLISGPSVVYCVEIIDSFLSSALPSLHRRCTD